MRTMKSFGTIELLEVRQLLSERPTAGSNPEELFDLSGTLYFSADDADHGVELWRSDGTEAGTLLVRDIVPGPRGARPRDFVAVGGTLYFFVNDPDGDMQLWRSDGTTAGTTLVADINQRLGFSTISHPVAFDGAIYFLGESSSRRTGGLLRSDGTAPGTEVVREFTQTPTASVQELIALGDAMYLTAVDPAHGCELGSATARPRALRS